MSTARIKVKNLPPAPPPTKSCRIGASFHQIPGMRDLTNPDKQLSKENEIIFEVRNENDAKEGLTITTNKYSFDRARRASLDAYDTWLNTFDVTASNFFDENDLPFLENSTLLEVACMLFRRLSIPAHIEANVDIVDPTQIADTFWVSKREDHLEKKRARKIPTYFPMSEKGANFLYGNKV